MNNFPPSLDNAPRSLDNAVAFDEAVRLLEYFPLRLTMSLSWLPDSFQWQCSFVTKDGLSFTATKPTAADAIEFAVEKVLKVAGVARG